MSEEGPKLYSNKPKKKAQVKQFQEQHKVKEASSPSAAVSNMASSSSPPTPPPPPPQLPKESFAKRYKFLWPLLLTVNLAVGAYLFMRTKKQDDDHVEEKAATTDSAKAASIAPLIEEPVATPTIVEPVKVVREPIPVDQQRELFKWILEEKRKIKPKDTEEKKRLDEEKAILKQFIRAKSIPNI